MGAPKMASFSTPAAAGVWLVPSRHGYKCTFPSYQSSNFLCPFSIATTTSDLLSLTFLSCHLLASRPLVHLKFTGSPLTQSAQISEHAPMEMIQCQQPQDYKQILLYLLTNTNDDRLFEPNSSEMDVTKPECPPPMAWKIDQRKPSPSIEIQQLSQANILNVELVHQACYQDPADDMDKDLSKVPEDNGRSNNTKKLNLRLKERWAR